jgi:hypothetical protein
MERTKRKAQEFTGKTIDAHSHTGVSLKAYGRMEYPYAQSIEDLRYRQLSAGVDINVVFPFSPDLHFSLTDLIESGEVKKAEFPLSPSPYAVENRLLMREIYDYCPEASAHFIPFVSADPGRAVSGQLAELKGLEEEYPVYGLKIIGVACQTRVTELLFNIAGPSRFRRREEHTRALSTRHPPRTTNILERGSRLRSREVSARGTLLPPRTAFSSTKASSTRPHLSRTPGSIRPR